MTVIFASVRELDDTVSDRLRVRALRPSDKQQLAAGFHRLSRQSRRSRFFRSKNEITADELCQLTEFDGTRHYALGAFELSEDGTERSVIGVARYFRIAENPENAELAVAVVDDRQGRGVGRLLVRRLLEEARDRGIAQVICYVLADNDRMLNLVERVFRKTALHREGDIVIGDFSIRDHPTHPPCELIARRTVGRNTADCCGGGRIVVEDKRITIDKKLPAE